MSANSEYVARMQAQLKKWDADFDALAARGEEAGAEARASAIRELRASRHAAASFVDQIRFATEAAGVQMRSSMESTWEAMRKALEKASSGPRK